MSQTFTFLKPDAIERNLTGKIITRFEEKGFLLTEIRAVCATKEILEEHYVEHKEKPFFPDLVHSLLGKTVVCMVWQSKSPNIVRQVRAMIGEASVEKRQPGTIRGDFASDLLANLIHSSDSCDAVDREMKLWLPALHAPSAK